jgi:hypothetical protein
MSFAPCIAPIWPLSVADWAHAVCRPAEIKHRSEERAFFLSELPHSQAESSVIFRRLGVVGSFSGWQTQARIDFSRSRRLSTWLARKVKPTFQSLLTGAWILGSRIFSAWPSFTVTLPKLTRPKQPLTSHHV